MGIIKYVNAINLDMKINSYGVLEGTTNSTYGIGYGISKAGGLNMKKDLPTSLQTILTAILGFAGTISLGFIVVGGIKLMLSKGSKAEYEKNVKLMLTGGIAFLIVLFAYAITRIVLGLMGTITG